MADAAMAAGGSRSGPRYQFSIKVCSADLSSASGLLTKPSAYVEVLVDGVLQKRSQCIKNSARPKWGETFTLLATRESSVLLRVCDHHTIVRDSVLGEVLVALAPLLRSNGGQLKAVPLTLPLTLAPHNKPAPSSEAAVPSISIKLDGFLKTSPVAAAETSPRPSPSTAPPPPAATSNGPKHNNNNNNVPATATVLPLSDACNDTNSPVPRLLQHHFPYATPQNYESNPRSNVHSHKHGARRENNLPLEKTGGIVRPQLIGNSLQLHRPSNPLKFPAPHSPLNKATLRCCLPQHRPLLSNGYMLSNPNLSSNATGLRGPLLHGLCSLQPFSAVRAPHRDVVRSKSTGKIADEQRLVIGGQVKSNVTRMQPQVLPVPTKSNDCRQSAPKHLAQHRRSLEHCIETQAPQHSQNPQNSHNDAAVPSYKRSISFHSPLRYKEERGLQPSLHHVRELPLRKASEDLLKKIVPVPQSTPVRWDKTHSPKSCEINSNDRLLSDETSHLNRTGNTIYSVVAGDAHQLARSPRKTTNRDAVVDKKQQSDKIDFSYDEEPRCKEDERSTGKSRSPRNQNPIAPIGIAGYSGSKVMTEVDRPKDISGVDRPKDITESSRPKNMLEVGRPKTAMTKVGRPKDKMDVGRPSGMMEVSKPKDMTEFVKPVDITKGDRPKNLSDGEKPMDLSVDGRPKDMTKIGRPKSIMEGGRPNNMMSGGWPMNPGDGRSKSKTEGVIPLRLLDDVRPKNSTDSGKPRSNIGGGRPKGLSEDNRLRDFKESDRPHELSEGGRFNGLLEGGRPKEILKSGSPNTFLECGRPKVLSESGRPKGFSECGKSMNTPAGGKHIGLAKKSGTHLSRSVEALDEICTNDMDNNLSLSCSADDSSLQKFSSRVQSFQYGFSKNMDRSSKAKDRNTSIAVNAPKSSNLPDSLSDTKDNKSNRIASRIEANSNEIGPKDRNKIANALSRHELEVIQKLIRTHTTELRDNAADSSCHLTTSTKLGIVPAPNSPRIRNATGDNNLAPKDKQSPVELDFKKHERAKKQKRQSIGNLFPVKFDMDSAVGTNEAVVTDFPRESNDEQPLEGECSSNRNNSRVYFKNESPNQRGGLWRNHPSDLPTASSSGNISSAAVVTLLTNVASVPLSYSQHRSSPEYDHNYSASNKLREVDVIQPTLASQSNAVVPGRYSPDMVSSQLSGVTITNASSAWPDVCSNLPNLDNTSRVIIHDEGRDENSNLSMEQHPQFLFHRQASEPLLQIRIPTSLQPPMIYGAAPVISSAYADNISGDRDSATSSLPTPSAPQQSTIPNSSEAKIPATCSQDSYGPIAPCSSEVRLRNTAVSSNHNEVVSSSSSQFGETTETRHKSRPCHHIHHHQHPSRRHQDESSLHSPSDTSATAAAAGASSAAAAVASPPAAAAAVGASPAFMAVGAASNSTDPAALAAAADDTSIPQG
ncbi:uncharacterized protein LOC108674622 [Hyalella azteca]|uniref:Uncharacterized protein LOC108674622 n=1 Tax=Hyalella azteca TaxID=294128 RepID=A0A8B7NWI1_HYAAZ|nr:uncharacterized protein LOC108674622 [Hyalella azteca]